ncbi:MAG: fasciclin domain-containing protein [Sphaerochaetaceae bacterium]|nr:fasciclin domain-containing protein [Sphaerochaetaceae bacterium]
MKKMIVMVLMSVLALSVVIGAGVRESDAMVEPTIVDIASADGRFTTLVAALQASDLVESLQGEGPFTVFAPTDDAFAKLPAGTVEALLGDIPTLADILLYHVVSGEVMASDVVGLSSAEAANGKSIDIRVEDSSVMLNDSKVIITDIKARNGVIHVIDTVLLPPVDTPSIAQIAAGDRRFTTLVAALGAAGLVVTLDSEGPFTVLAPTDDAFAKLPAGTVEALLADIPTLTDILLYHVIPGKIMASDVMAFASQRTANGDDVILSMSKGDVTIQGANVLIADIEAENGVIHVIDTVLLPPQ